MKLYEVFILLLHHACNFFAYVVIIGIVAVLLAIGKGILINMGLL